LRVIVIGDIHTQAEKLWSMLREAGLADAAHNPTPAFLESDDRLVLLGDLLHAKGREQYAELIGAPRFDEFDPAHIRKAERAQEAFLGSVKAFYDRLPPGRMTILMGNHDYNAIHPEQGPLRTDDVAHLEWKDKSRLPKPLAEWIAAWPHEHALEGVHFAHVGPRPEHNTYDNSFYLENRRRWIYEDQDWLAGTPYKMGVYGHTPVRGGVNIASQGRAILLDTNGHGDEYCFLELTISPEGYRLKMRGLFFDERIQRG
jgi:hypothetical protein